MGIMDAIEAKIIESIATQLDRLKSQANDLKQSGLAQMIEAAAAEARRLLLKAALERRS
jgi:hypothetical protein